MTDDAEPQHAGGFRTLETVLADLCSNASAVRWLSKAEVLKVLSSNYEGDPESAFALIRSAAKNTGVLGSLRVSFMGSRRGTRYAFGGSAVEPSEHGAASSPTERPAKTPIGGLRDFPVPGCPPESGSIAVFQGDNLEVTRSFKEESFDLIYIDPPFNTRHSQSRTRIRTEQDEDGDRIGFQGRRYRTTVVGSSSYSDNFDDYMAFLAPRLEEAHRLLKPEGSFFLHLDYREVHYAKVALDKIFGRECFINEIIWAYDYGARATNRWSPKHDNILWYAKNPAHYCFNYDEIDRIPYMAPSLVGAEKAARGKTPTDTWWHTIVSPNGKEKTGYPTQKPLGVLTRIVRVHSKPGDALLDFFAGSGSFGEAAASLGRNATLVDEHPEAIAVMRRRFEHYRSTFHNPLSPDSSTPLAGETIVQSPQRAAGEPAAVASDGTSLAAPSSQTSNAPANQCSAKRAHGDDAVQGSLF